MEHRTNIQAAPVPLAAIEQYKQEMLAQARRTQFEPPRTPQPKPEPKTLHTAEPVIEPTPEVVEKTMQATEIAVEVAPDSASTEIVFAAQSVELNIEAIEEHLEYKQEQAVPPQPLAPDPASIAVPVAKSSPIAEPIPEPESVPVPVAEPTPNPEPIPIPVVEPEPVPVIESAASEPTPIPEPKSAQTQTQPRHMPTGTRNVRKPTGGRRQGPGNKTARAPQNNSALANQEWLRKPAGQENATPAAAYPLTDADEIFHARAYVEEPTVEGKEPIEGTFEMPIPVFDSMEDFRAQNPAQGLLNIHVVLAQTDAPVAGARVQVTKQIGQTNYLFYDAQTDPSGNAGPIALPAPPKELSYDENAIPYALYDVQVTHNDRRQDLLNVSIFPDTTAIQNVHLDRNAAPINQALYTR